MAISDRSAERQSLSCGRGSEAALAMLMEAHQEMMASSGSKFDSRANENILAMALARNSEQQDSEDNSRQREVLALPRAPAVTSYAHLYLPQLELV